MPLGTRRSSGLTSPEDNHPYYSTRTKRDRSDFDVRTDRDRSGCSKGKYGDYSDLNVGRIPLSRETKNDLSQVQLGYCDRSTD